MFVTKHFLLRCVLDPKDHVEPVYAQFLSTRYKKWLKTKLCNRHAPSASPKVPFRSTHSTPDGSEHLIPWSVSEKRLFFRSDFFFAKEKNNSYRIMREKRLHAHKIFLYENILC